MKILSVVGARPQFIKAKPIIDELAKSKARHILVHTGQHYDYKMSKVFFEELNIPEPDYNLGVGSDTPGKQTAAMMERVERVLLKERPHRAVVYGDTNSTLAGALAAAKLKIPVCHVEAGLRSYNKEMPEEINRILTDHLSAILFCPTETALENLKKEGITEGAHVVGDTMYDAILRFADIADKRSNILKTLGLKPKTYLLSTIHRPSNSDIAENLRKIFRAFGEISESIVLPVHPRTLRNIKNKGLKAPLNVRLIKPVGYMDMIMLEKNARMILTDSGGMQKESYWLGIPCLTLREETEWVETVKSGWNKLTGCDPGRIVKGAKRMRPTSKRPSYYGDGRAAEHIANCLTRFTGER